MLLQEPWCSRDGPWLALQENASLAWNVLGILQWDYFCIVVVAEKSFKKRVEGAETPFYSVVLQLYLYLYLHLYYLCQ